MGLFDVVRRMLGGDPDAVPLRLPKAGKDPLLEVASSFGGTELQKGEAAPGKYVAEFHVGDSARRFAFPEHESVEAVVLNMCFHSNTMVSASIVETP